MGQTDPLQNAEEGEPGCRRPGRRRGRGDAATQEGQAAGESSYFSTARLNRQQARDNAISLLQEAAKDEKADQAAVDEANQAIQTMADATMTEAQIENLVTAKGYTDCVAFMGEDSISVVVSAMENGMTDADAARIGGDRQGTDRPERRSNQNHRSRMRPAASPSLTTESLVREGLALLTGAGILGGSRGRPFGHPLRKIRPQEEPSHV